MKSFFRITFFLSLLTLCLIFSCRNATTNTTSSFQTPETTAGSSDDVDGIEAGTKDIITTYDATTKDTSALSSYTVNSTNDNRDIITDANALSDLSFTDTIYINLSTLQASQDNSTWTSLTDGGDSATVITGINVSLSDNVLSIDSSNYSNNLKINITGTTAKGALYIKGKKNTIIQLYLDNAKITSSGNYPCLNVDSKTTVYIALSGTNTFTDGRSFGIGYSKKEGTAFYTSSYTGDTSNLDLTADWEKGDNTKGSVYTKGPFLFTGDGSLTITEGYKHAVYSKDYIRLMDSFSGTISINTTGRNAFQSVNGFVMDSGTINILGTGTHTNNESRGIIVEGADDNPGEGFIVINDGKITSTTVSKGISAKWDIDDSDDNSDTSTLTDDPYPYVLIAGGEINIETTGTPADESTSTTNVMDADGVTTAETTKLSPEGIEGKQNLFITGGKIYLNTTDDCINTSNSTSVIKISGGNIFAYSSKNDSIDSNGQIYISGGVIVALTKTTPECAFDCDENTFSITGGLILGIGTNNYTVPGTCSQSTVVLSGNYFRAGGTTFAIEESDGDPVFVYEIPSGVFGTTTNKNYIMILSSPDIKTGTTYKAVTGVTPSDGETFYGLYHSLPTVSGGTSTLSTIATTTSSYVYTKTSSTNNGPGDGPQNW